MICPNCGSENPADARVCENCGAELPEVNQPAKARKIRFLPIVIISAAILLAVILIAAAVSLIGGRSVDYVFVKQDVTYFGDGTGIPTIFFVNGKPIGKTIDGKVERADSSIDEFITLFKATEDDMTVYYTLRGRTLIKVTGSEEWANVTLSDSGEGIAYTVEGEDEVTLYLYDVSRQKSTKVESAAHISCEALSPDGESLVYVIWDDNADGTAYFFDGKKSVKLAEGIHPFGLSNGGKYIYNVSEDNDGSSIIELYNKKGEKVREIGEVNSFWAIEFNTDHTEILYENEGKTYISANGKDGSLFFDDLVTILTPEDTSFRYGRQITRPVGSFYNRYYCVGTELYQIGKNPDKSIKLASDVGRSGGSGIDYFRCILSDDESRIYYRNEDGDLRMIKTAWGRKASDKAVTIAENVDYFSFAVNSDCSRVFYCTDDTLYSAKGDGKSRRMIADEVYPRIMLGNGDILYFQKGQELYACSDGKNASLVLPHAEREGGYGYLGYLYFFDEGTIYCTTGSKKPKKVYSVS